MIDIVRTARRSLHLMTVRQRDIVLLLVLGLLVAALEGVGMGLLLPVLQLVERGPDSVNGTVWRLASALPLPPLLALMSISFCAILARQVVRYVHQVRAEALRLQAIGRMRTDAFAAILKSDLPFFAEERQGRLVNALTSQIEWGASALPFVLQLAEATILLAVYTVILALLAPWLIPFAAAAIVIVVLIVRARMRTTRGYGSRVSAALEALHVTVAEKLSGIRLVKVRVREREEADAYRGQVRELTSVLMTLNRQKEALEVAIEPTMILGAFCALYASVRWFGMTLASVSVVMLILLRLVPYLKQMTTAGQLFGALMASLEDVQNVVDTARKARTITSGPITFGGLARDVRFDRVGFRYQDSPDRWAVRDASFTLTRGTLTALVGRSGAGKSTTLDLIARLRDPVEGEILFDGVPASRFTLTSLRSAVGIVDQDGFLFHDTVASNIACGLSGVSSSDIAAAARRAHADEFITQLPRGYDTLIGDRGVRLSGGQRQRLSLARVILQNPDILLLDEPTSALDAESEELIQDALEALRRTKVVVVAAHRLSTVRRASQILVLEDGGIVERGDHTSLMTEEGIYRRLFDLQIHV